jgi:hypothetical protein
MFTTTTICESAWESMERIPCRHACLVGQALLDWCATHTFMPGGPGCRLLSLRKNIGPGTLKVTVLGNLDFFDTSSNDLKLVLVLTFMNLSKTAQITLRSSTPSRTPLHSSPLLTSTHRQQPTCSCSGRSWQIIMVSWLLVCKKRRSQGVLGKTIAETRWGKEWEFSPEACRCCQAPLQQLTKNWSGKNAAARVSRWCTHMKYVAAIYIFDRTCLPAETQSVGKRMNNNFTLFSKYGKHPLDLTGASQGYSLWDLIRQGILGRPCCHCTEPCKHCWFSTMCKQSDEVWNERDEVKHAPQMSALYEDSQWRQNEEGVGHCHGFWGIWKAEPRSFTPPKILSNSIWDSDWQQPQSRH